VPILIWFFLTASVLGLGYLGVAIAVTYRFERRLPDPPPAAYPSMTVLKPVYGVEEGLYDALASFCDQHYDGDYEVIFCIHRADDPAVPVIEDVIATFPGCSARIMSGDDATHRNPKIANLSKGAAVARGEIVVIADSDVRVDRDYLQALAASFADERTGAVTCLYRGVPRRGLVGQLGAAYVEEQFAPSVLVALAFGTLRFCLGATMAVRHGVLDAIGGIDALGPYLADDHKLGELVASHGSDVKLSRYVVATAIPETRLSELWTHEVRWGRTTFVQAPVGYALSFVMYALPLAVAYLLLARDAFALAVVVAALALRIGLHYAARSALGVKRPDAAWVGPLRDFLSLAVWFASLFRRTLRWRDAVVGVDAKGELTA